MVLRRIPLLAVLFALVLSVCAVALAAETFSDPTGDVKAGSGPDVVAVKLSNTRGGGFDLAPGHGTFHHRLS